MACTIPESYSASNRVRCQVCGDWNLILPIGIAQLIPRDQAPYGLLVR